MDQGGTRGVLSIGDPVAVIRSEDSDQLRVIADSGQFRRADLGLGNEILADLGVDDLPATLVVGRVYLWGHGVAAPMSLACGTVDKDVHGSLR